MNITHATYHPISGLTVTIDGHPFYAGNKRTVLDLGFVFLVPDAEDEAAQTWLEANSSGLPAGPDWGATKGPGMVQNPVVVELALRAWEAELAEGDNPIPSEEEAADALKRRGVPTMNLVDGRFEPWI